VSEKCWSEVFMFAAGLVKNLHNNFPSGNYWSLQEVIRYALLYQVDCYLLL